MGLFDNGREANTRSCIAMVEDVLEELGHDPTTSRQSADDGNHVWRFQFGSARITVQIVDRDDFTHLRVCSPVMSTDARVDLLKLYRHLLVLNANAVHGAAFAARQNEVQIVSERSTIDIDRSEVKDLIGRVSKYADDFDDKLVDEFGGRTGGV